MTSLQFDKSDFFVLCVGSHEMEGWEEELGCLLEEEMEGGSAACQRRPGPVV